jgi:hypothetical protein
MTISYWEDGTKSVYCDGCDCCLEFWEEGEEQLCASDYCAYIAEAKTLKKSIANLERINENLRKEVLDLEQCLQSAYRQMENMT